MTRNLLPVPLALLVLLLFGCSDQVASPDLSSSQDRTDGSSAPEYLGGIQSAAKGGKVHNFVAPLSGGEEVPPADTKGRGLSKFQLNKEGNALSFKLIAANIEGVTQAHIHCGAAGVNGPVVAFLYGFNADGISPNGVLSEGTITPADVILRPDSPQCPGGVANFDEMLAKMASGDAYVNVHTLVYPGGEIRGQITRGNGVDR